MTRISLDDIKKKVNELAAKINAPINHFPTYGYTTGTGCPHIEITYKGLFHRRELFHFVENERGKEYVRKTTDNLDTLLYWIFSSVTFSMASDYELKHRIEDKDFRRIMFDRQEELLGILSDTWRQKGNERHKDILKKYPFDDLAGLRATYCRQLRKQGYSEIEIKKLAYEKFPEN